jgi:hypothetical protein
LFKGAALDARASFEVFIIELLYSFVSHVPIMAHLCKRSNKKIKFEVKEVPNMTTGYPTFNYNTLGLYEHTSDTDQLTFSVLTTKGELSVGRTGLWKNLTAGQLISTFFWHMVSGSPLAGSTDNKIINTTDYKLYVNTDPKSSGYYINLSWSFIK